MASRENARRFHFLREIATGGFGTVWLCKVLHADGFTRIAAVKLLKTQWTDSEEIVRRIRDEARLLGLLRHRAIITVYDLTSIDGRAAVVMEYIEGVDLRTVVKALRNRDETVPVRTVLDIGATVAGALDAAYNQPPMPGDKPLRVIHRDIKPSNIMVDIHGDLKVLDFGVARSDIDNRESHTEELQFGSVDYMAPERLFFEPETPAGDIYALGATIFELLAREKLGKARGRPAQHAAEVEDRLSYLRATTRVRSTVATELVDLLRSCLRYEHEERPTAAELQQRCRALARLVEDEELRPWAERVIPPLHTASVAAPRQPSPMSDSIRLEDSVSFSAGQPPLADQGGEDLGNRLRKGALRELEDSTGRVRPDQQARAAGPRPARPLFTGPQDDSLLLPEPEAAATPAAAKPAAAAARAAAAAAKPAAATPVAAAAKPAAAAATPAAAKPAVAAARAAPAAAKPAAAAAKPAAAKPAAAAAAAKPAAAAAAAKPAAARPSPVDPGAAAAQPARPHPAPRPRPVGAFTTGSPVFERGTATRGGDPADDWTDLPTHVEGLTMPARDAEAQDSADALGAADAPTQAGVADPGMVDLPTAGRPQPLDEAPLRLSPATGAPPRPNGAAARARAAVEDSGAYEAEPTVVDPTDIDPDELTASALDELPLDAPDLDDPGPPPGRRRAMVLGGLAGGCLLLVVSGLLVSVGGWWFASRTAGELSAETLLEDLDAAASGAASPVDASTATADDGEQAQSSGMAFASLDPDTRKLSVRCNEGEGKGSTTAQVDLSHADRCTVTAILADRSRRVAVLDDVGAGSYDCFSGGQATCERR